MITKSQSWPTGNRLRTEDSKERPQMLLYQNINRILLDVTYILQCILSTVCPIIFGNVGIYLIYEYNVHCTRERVCLGTDISTLISVPSMTMKIKKTVF